MEAMTVFPGGFLVIAKKHLIGPLQLQTPQQQRNLRRQENCFCRVSRKCGQELGEGNLQAALAPRPFTEGRRT